MTQSSHLTKEQAEDLKKLMETEIDTEKYKLSIAHVDPEETKFTVGIFTVAAKKYEWMSDLFTFGECIFSVHSSGNWQEIKKFCEITSDVLQANDMDDYYEASSEKRAGETMEQKANFDGMWA